MRSTPRVTTAELAAAVERGDRLTIVDSRELHEWAAGHIPGAVWMTIWRILEAAATLPREAPVAVHCAHGYRSAVATSLLERADMPAIQHVTDGYEEWQRHWQ